MLKFLKNIILFLLLAMVIGELIVRLTHVTSDIPQRTIDEMGIQKYYPNQEGYWKGGNHKWMINSMGWPGQLPNSFNNLFIIIGDSYIENFMNPLECHQSHYLKQNLKDYNFMEAGRSGISFIETMEISKQLDSLKPLKTLIYINNFDFQESISDIKLLNDITQLNLKNGKIKNGKMKAPGLKKVLYSIKLLYYFYNRFYSNVDSKESEQTSENISQDDIIIKYQSEIVQLIDYVSENYELKNKILVFHPNTAEVIIRKCKAVGFEVITLDSSSDKSWEFKYDSHWTCYGHRKAAEQVSKDILKKL